MRPLSRKVGSRLLVTDVNFATYVSFPIDGKLTSMVNVFGKAGYLQETFVVQKETSNAGHCIEMQIYGIFELGPL